MLAGRTAVLLAVSVATAALGACGTSDSNPPPLGDGTTCTPGSHQPCSCADGTTGTQICASDGKGFGVCNACGLNPTDAGYDAAFNPRDGSSDSPSSSDSSASDAADAGSNFTSSMPGSAFEGETHIAVAPNGTLAAVWIGFPSSGPFFIGYTFSTDSGTTWTPVQAVTSPISGQAAGDPTVAVDASNNFYVAFEGFLVAGGQLAEAHVYTATAAAGTTTFGAPVEVTDPAQSNTPSDGGLPALVYDKPWIAVTSGQEIIVTYTQFDQNGVANVTAGRSSTGTSWTRAKITTNTSSSNTGDTLAFPCVSTSTSRLWVVDDSSDASGNTGVALHWSDDDGATWPAANTAVVAAPTATGFFDDPSCAGDGNDVWVQYELAGAGATVATSIEVAHSSNGGTSFGSPVNAQDMTASADSFHGQILLDSNGGLEVEYYGGASDGDSNASVYLTRSKDRGATWSAATVLKNPVTLTSNRSHDMWLGDYLGLAAAGGVLYSTFTDNSSGVHVDFARLTLP